MRRYIESALRLRFRILIAAVLVFGLAAVALSFNKGGYTSSATIWVEKPIYFQDPSNLNAYISAATLQSGILDQLLGTTTFKLTIAQKSKIPMRTAVEQARVIDDLNKNLRVDAAGSNLIKLTYTGDKPEYCQQIISQTIQTFVAQQNANRMQQAEIALTVAQDQIDNSGQQLAKSKEALTKYIQDHPGSGTRDVPDPTYTDLEKQYNDDLSNYSQLKDKIDNLKSQITAPTLVNTSFLTVLDEPTKPEAYKAGTKDLLKNGGIALALALITIIGLTLVGTWTDTAVYTLNDVTSMALADSEGNARELLVGIVPYVPALGAIRRRVAKQTRGRRSRQAAASTTGRGASTVAASTRR